MGKQSEYVGMLIFLALVLLVIFLPSDTLIRGVLFILLVSMYIKKKGVFKKGG